MTLPNLLIIGGMKCGSTSLHAYLDKHPEIQMSDPKELDFFSYDKNYEKGLDWYSTFFKPGYKYNGESSVSYSKKHTHPFVPRRINANLGDDVKIIYIVRDPIDRFQSNYTDSKTYGDIPSSYSINTFVASNLEENPFVKTSMYYYQIQEYLKYFDLKNMYFLKAEDLKSEPQTAMTGLFEFLGLEPVSVEEIVLNNSSSKTYYATNYVKVTQSGFVQGLKKLIPSTMVEAIKGSKAIKNVSRKKIHATKDVLTDENRERLKDFFSEDIKQFEALTNLKLNS
ncbi:sulfotransferase domain-containing protein [Winogradskyella eckloniae]|uniref:sulfotransferase domain-containing protein n=1 Tax=Winogradskyella eckloniae TaxID=1089306 RepID=UPI0015657CCE|nr:sulfotransferase domain-containing protein [Winogradskyella eckloniae]NRD20818.1 sulfotransferase domain-containing protein [Winogradskyella eckloniae]